MQVNYRSCTLVGRVKNYIVAPLGLLGSYRMGSLTSDVILRALLKHRLASGNTCLEGCREKWSRVGNAMAVRSLVFLTSPIRSSVKVIEGRTLIHRQARTREWLRRRPCARGLCVVESYDVFRSSHCLASRIIK